MTIFLSGWFAAIGLTYLILSLVMLWYDHGVRALLVQVKDGAEKRDTVYSDSYIYRSTRFSILPSLVLSGHFC